MRSIDAGTAEQISDVEIRRVEGEVEKERLPKRPEGN
jgi:hypothetical protein